jgi:hypothetical protein
MDSEDILEKVKEVRSNFWGTLIAFLIGLLLFFGLGLLIFRITCVNFVDNYEIAYKYDTTTGKIERLNHTGYIVTPPFLVKVHSVDGRPMQVCISAIQRVLNCKLVEFNPSGLELFLQWHGRNDYTNDGGTRETPTPFNQILMAYAYDGSGKSYPFLTVIRELKPEEVTAPVEKPR